MTVFEAAPVDYQRTARRPAWQEIPEEVRGAIEDRTGVVEHSTVAGGGFTPAFAGALAVADGNRVFVKAADATTEFGSAIRREAAVLEALPQGLPTPRMQWSETLHGWAVLCLDFIDGYMPGQPWTSGDLKAILDVQTQVATGLALPSTGLREAAEKRSFAEHCDELLTTWREAIDRTATVPDIPDWLVRNMPELARLEASVPHATRDAAGLMHFDLRPDNAIITKDGSRILDWNWTRPGPSYVDTVMLLVTAYGHQDVEQLVAEHPTTTSVDAEVIDGILAALGGLMIAAGRREMVASSPWLRTHQYGQGVRALSWLGSRRGWH